MSRNELASKLIAAAVVLTAPAFFLTSHAHADEIGREIGSGECSSREECEEEDNDPTGIFELVGLGVAGFGFAKAAGAISRAINPKYQKAKAEGADALARYQEVVERAKRIRAVRVQRLEAENEQRRQAEREQRIESHKAGQVLKAENAQRTKIEHADKRIKVRRAQRIRRAPLPQKDNGAHL